MATHRSATVSGSGEIRVVAAAIVEDCRLLVVRKRSGGLMILPGGKPHVGESELDTVQREIWEELRCGITALTPFGQFTAPAAHEDEASVCCSVYLGSLVGSPTPSGEIPEHRWVPLENTTGMAALHAQLNPQLEAHHRDV
jgi:8-oxo-dGTP diphosphatase